MQPARPRSMADEPGDAAVAQPPTDLGKSLRCCVPCRLVKSFEQFYEQASGAMASGSRQIALLKPRHTAVHGPAAAATAAARRCRSQQANAPCVLPALQGCENCPYLDMEGDRERVFDCTTSEFKVCGCSGRRSTQLLQQPCSGA